MARSFTLFVVVAFITGMACFVSLPAPTLQTTDGGGMQTTDGGATSFCNRLDAQVLLCEDFEKPIGAQWSTHDGGTLVAEGFEGTALRLTYTPGSPTQKTWASPSFMLPMGWTRVIVEYKLRLHVAPATSGYSQYRTMVLDFPDASYGMYAYVAASLASGVTLAIAPTYYNGMAEQISVSLSGDRKYQTVEEILERSSPNMTAHLQVGSVTGNGDAQSRFTTNAVTIGIDLRDNKASDAGQSTAGMVVDYDDLVIRAE
jgi:hypothetical protein